MYNLYVCIYNNYTYISIHTCMYSCCLTIVRLLDIHIKMGCASESMTLIGMTTVRLLNIHIQTSFTNAFK